MNTLTINIVCKKHTPNKSAISDVADTQFTFCEMCENNIERFYDDSEMILGLLQDDDRILIGFSKDSTGKIGLPMTS